MERLEEAAPRGASAPSGERPGAQGATGSPRGLGPCHCVLLRRARTAPGAGRFGGSLRDSLTPTAPQSAVRRPPSPPQYPYGRVLTEAAVVVAGAVHRAVGEDLEVEARAAVELAAPQDPLQVGEVCGRAALQLPLDLAQAFVQETRGVS